MIGSFEMLLFSGTANLESGAISVETAQVVRI